MGGNKGYEELWRKVFVEAVKVEREQTLHLMTSVKVDNEEVAWDVHM